jgi:hypothetical protein
VEEGRHFQTIDREKVVGKIKTFKKKYIEKKANGSLLNDFHTHGFDFRIRLLTAPQSKIEIHISLLKRFERIHSLGFCLSSSNL